MPADALSSAPVALAPRGHNTIIILLTNDSTTITDSSQCHAVLTLILQVTHEMFITHIKALQWQYAQPSHSVNR